jgi:hypothetical protein
MNNPEYPNIERLIRTVDSILGFVFSIAKGMFWLLVITIIVVSVI